MPFRWLLATAAAAVLLVPAVASATIVPQRSIHGVALQMTQQRVRAILGSPQAVRRGSNVFGAWIELRFPGLRVTFQGEQVVTELSTTSRVERTATGVGVGSTEAQVKARLSGIRCRTEGHFRHCFLGRFLAGRRVTDLTIRRGRVARVTIGFVLD